MITPRSVQAVETHSGEPMRVVTGGLPHIPGDTVYEQTKWLAEHDDQLRKMLLREPRGYPSLCCNLIVPPKHPDADAGFIIMEQTEYPMMSGGNTISVATVLLETGMIPMQEPETTFTLEAPAGLVGITAQCNNGRATSIRFENLPAFAVYLDAEIEVPTLGTVTVDVAWGGMFYVIADVDQFDGVVLSEEHGAEITRIGSLLIGAAQQQLPVSHPDYPGVGITIAQLSGPGVDPTADRRNATVVASGEIDLDNPATWKGAIDRCPCGTGTCAKMAIEYARGRLSLDEPFRHEGILGNIYTGMLTQEVESVSEHPAVVPTIEGQSWITGYATWVLQHDDPLPEGFRMGDIWG